MLREKTAKAVQQSFSRWRQRPDPPPAGPGCKVLFLGTGGNPEATLSQEPRTSGFVLQVNDLLMYVDPGPGAVVRAREYGLDLGALDVVYISHGHLDHYAGAEPVIEGMCRGMFARRGYLLAPGQLLDDDGLISKYHQGLSLNTGYKGGPRVVRLQGRQPVVLKDVVLTPVPAYHGPENYGFVLESNGLSIGYTSDTNYILRYRDAQGEQDAAMWGPVMDLQAITGWRQDIKEIYSQVDVLIANVTTHNIWLHRHITTLGLAHLLRGGRVRLCFITHFNHCCVWPEDLRSQMADYVRGSCGVRTIAACDGARYDLGQMLGR